MKEEQLNEMSLQEACDFAVLKIVGQGGKCLSDEGNCAYGDGRGNHCAVGWLLDEEDGDLMSYRGTVNGLATSHDLPSLITENKYAFRLLQYFHDHKGAFREKSLDDLSKYIDTSAPQYQQWVDMGV